MTVFISYARANQAVAEQLRGDVERCHREVWVDRELTGGQSWWRTILHHIRNCDVFVVALSPEWVQSRACDLELRYALALRRPVLPVMVAKIDPRLAPPAVADAQILDYLQRSPETTFALRDALDTLPSAPPLPSVPPPEPQAPISYLHNIITALNAPTLDSGNQYWLWEQLQAALGEADDDERAGLLTLVRRLRKRRDLLPQLRSGIDAVLGTEAPPGERTVPRAHPVVWPAPTPRDVPAVSRRRRTWVGAAAVFVAVVACLAVIGDKGGEWKQHAHAMTTAPPTTAPTVPDTGRPDPADPQTPGSTPPEPTCTMPDLTGFFPDEAEGALRNGAPWRGQFDDSQTAFVSDQEMEGKILDQNPPPNTNMKCDDPVAVILGVLEDIPSPTELN